MLDAENGIMPSPPRASLIEGNDCRCPEALSSTVVRRDEGGDMYSKAPGFEVVVEDEHEYGAGGPV